MMAYPTQITIASGKTVYEGDPESDEGITSRQVQVSVTYQLERADDDLLHVTATKAKEVEAAQEAVWRQVRGSRRSWGWIRNCPRARRATRTTPSGRPGEDQERTAGRRERVDDEPPFYGGGEKASEDHGGRSRADGGIAPPYHPRRAVRREPCTPAAPGRGTAPGTATERSAPTCPVPSASHRERVAQSIRKPQKLAIEAQARRLGLSDQALAETIRERFGKESYTPRFAVDKLTKAEADALLRALQAPGHGDGQAIRPGQAMPA